MKIEGYPLLRDHYIRRSTIIERKKKTEQTESNGR